MKVIRLVGLRRAAKMKRHHEQGLTYIRGYATTCAWRTLLNCGFLDELEKKGRLSLRQYIADTQCSRSTLETIIEYLDGISLLKQDGDIVTFCPAGRAIFQEPRGMFELLWAYEPCFTNLAELLSGDKQYGRDLTRDVTYVGIGSGRLCEQLPYPVMRRMISDHNCKMILDLGCGDMGLISGLCRENSDIRAHGIDVSSDMIEFCQQQLTQQNYDGRLTAQQADMFNIAQPPETPLPIDCITACDTFHEYLQQPEKIVQLLRGLRGVFPQAIFVIGEFCLQDPDWLRKHPTASLEHHLFHQLSNQKIGSAQQWRDIFAEAELTIIEEQVYDLIGHGYFALR